MSSADGQGGKGVISTWRVALMGTALISVGMFGFYTIPGCMSEDAPGSKVINAFYCSVITLTTVGFGDICPGKNLDDFGHIFLTIFPLLGLGFFCGPILELASFWRTQVPGGPVALAAFTLTIGASMLTVLENLSLTESLHLCVIVGTTVGYGNITPSSDLGRLVVAIYAILGCNVMGGLLGVVKDYLESFCRTQEPAAISSPPATDKKAVSDPKKKKKKKKA